jgi:hypothetical protein
LFVQNEVMTNTSLRGRFGLGDDQAAQTTASRIIRDTVEQNLVKSADADSRSRKMARYVPFWG